jgi:hypothetical protein
MDINQIVEMIRHSAPMIVQYILMGLGVLVVCGRAYIYATPTQDDDKWFAELEEKSLVGKLLKVLIAFSPVGRSASLDIHDDVDHVESKP